MADTPHFILDCSGIQNWKPRTGVRSATSEREASWIEEKAVRTAAAFAGGSQPLYDMLNRPPGQAAATVAIQNPPRGFSYLSPPTKDCTLGLGGTYGAGMVFCHQVGSGVYGSTANPHFGFYFGVGVGIGVNVGISGGAQLTVLFGPPTLFNGTCYEVAVTVGSGLYLGGSLLFSAMPGTAGAQWFGFTVSGGGTIGPLPASITLYFNQGVASGTP